MQVIHVPQRIHRLSHNLANQIAAGEVIERPASVVKELVENSLDAGADDIRIDIEQGGSQLIRVVDNGRGIHREDFHLAIDRHATSKIHTLDDLEAIQSLGFRGEALASIAAIARMRMVSRCHDQAMAHEFVKNPDEASIDVHPAAHPPGTTIEIKDLFFNTPARKKFLRTDKTEFLHILAQVKRLSLSAFDASFRLRHNGHNSFRCNITCDNPVDRIRDVCGNAFIKHTSPFEFVQDGMRLWGWMGHPEFTRSQNDQQYFFLNGRIIRDRQVNHAIRLAYQDLVYPGRYPVYVIYLELPPRTVDINVHPTKHEVRFRNARNIHDFIRSNLSAVLQAPDSQTMDLNSNQVFGGDSPVFRIKESSSSYPGAKLNTAGNKNQYRFLSVMNGQYLIIDRLDQVQLVDVGAVRLQISLLSMHKNFTENKCLARPLLVPFVMNITEHEIDVLIQQQPLIEKLGLVIEQLGSDTLRVMEIPVLLPQADINLLIRDVIKVITNCKGKGSDLADELISAMSLHVNDDIPGELSGDAVNKIITDIEMLKLHLRPAEYNRLITLLDRPSLNNLLNQS